MNYVNADEKFKPEFGGSRCWYTQRYAMLLYFGVPIAMSSLLKMFLYVHTSINLHKAFKNTPTTTKVDSYHFGIYVKLFFLMGITWIFGFISAFTDEIVVDIIFVILTSLQGFFLFVSCVCNKRVLTEVRKVVTSQTEVTSSSSSSSGKKTSITWLPSYDTNSNSESKV